jgi:DNA-binding cell septation regulator SpoVG
MINNSDLQKFMDNIKKAEAGHKLDLSSDEDLSVAIMNLISIEEHMFFTAQKTGKSKYLDILHQAREMRKELLKTIVKDYEGEVWCISKHLLAASMRLFEVGTKAYHSGDQSKAKDLYQKSYSLYNLFWGLNLGMVKPDSKSLNSDDVKEAPVAKKSDFFGKINSVVGKILDCCRE